MRDIAIARSTDGGQTFAAPVRVSADVWKIDACPDDGPSLAIAGDGAIHVAWPTLLQDGGAPHMAIFEATSRDGGATFTPRSRVDASSSGASHPRIAVSRGDRMVVWDEVAAEGRRVMYRAPGARVPLAEGEARIIPRLPRSPTASRWPGRNRPLGVRSCEWRTSAAKHSRSQPSTTVRDQAQPYGASI